MAADAVVAAIERVHGGRTAIDRSRSSGYRCAGHQSDAGPMPGRVSRALSRRESEVLQRMACGLNNRQIAQKLFISEETVKSHGKAVLRKLRATERAQGWSSPSRTA